MSDRPNQPNTGDDLPPIPDGGLGQDFPDWLRERPHWVAVARTPPGEVDTSAIDPRDLVTIADLPQWLQAIARDPEARLQGLTLPPLPAERRRADGPSDSGENVPDIVSPDAAATRDDPVPVVDQDIPEADGPWARTFAPYSDVRADQPQAPNDRAGAVTGQPFPNYVPPPSASQRSRFLDPWVIGLIGAALGVLVATIVFLLIQ